MEVQGYDQLGRKGSQPHFFEMSQPVKEATEIPSSTKKSNRVSGVGTTNSMLVTQTERNGGGGVTESDV